MEESRIKHTDNVNSTYKRLIDLLNKSRTGKWIKFFLFSFLFVGVFGPFLANEKPLYCKIENGHYFPVFRSILIDAGLTTWQPVFQKQNWKEIKYDRKILPLIPYSANTLDISTASLISPFEKQDVSVRNRHWLGTDPLGRDVLAGIIYGTRVSMLIGIGSVLLSTILGIVLGLFAGYYGDNKRKMRLDKLLFAVIIGIITIYYLLNVSLLMPDQGALIKVLSCFAIILTSLGFYKLLTHISRLIFRKSLVVRLPLDLLLMRTIEIFRTIPALILLLAILAIIPQSGIAVLVLIIALLFWPTVARYTRAEMLKIRETEYIKSVQALGVDDWKIMFKHALPNAVAPILVIMAFGIASAILLEATLSFLGFGLALDDVSWGSLLSDARKNFKAWWLAIFPGIAIFLTITTFNLLGEKVQEALGKD